MKQKRLSLRQQITNLKKLISDGIKLGFNKKLLANYSIQLRELEQESKTRSKGIELRPVEFKALIKKVVIKTIKTIEPCVTITPLHKTIYIGGLGYIREDIALEHTKKFNKFIRGMASREKKLEIKHIEVCNNL